MLQALEHLSDSELISRLKRSAEKERILTHTVIAHLAELERRRLFAELGYCSLYDYAVRALGYTPASAQRRVKAAKVLLIVPEAYDCLKDGSLSLGVLEVISDGIEKTNGKALLRDVCGKSKAEALEVVAHYFPVQACKLVDRIVPVVRERNSDKITSLRAESRKIVENKKSDECPEGEEEENEVEYQLSFTVSVEVREKLERAQELMNRFGDLEGTLDELLEEYLKRHCPRERAKRRQAREEKKAWLRGDSLTESIETVLEAAGAVVPQFSEEERSVENSRYIPAKLRDEVLNRDGHCCTYVAADGTRCQARKHLDLDHILPFAVGGRTELENLRTTCRAHNFLYARQWYGEERIEEILRRHQVDGNGRPQKMKDVNFWDPAERDLFWG